MPATIRNIALYLMPKIGNRKDYKLVLSIYGADHANGGIPYDKDSPIAIAERKVDDIDHPGWFVFNFENDINLPDGYYCMMLNQRRDNHNTDTDFETNFVSWVHSQDISSLRSVYGISSYGGFSSLSGYGVVDAQSEIYGYGQGDEYGGTNYFDVIDVSGEESGYGINDGFGYGYGFEEVAFSSDPTIHRCFKVYENFNDIEFLDTDQKLKINLPANTEEVLVLDNRQDFMASEKVGVDIVGNLITLSNSGDRLYASDSSTFSQEKTFSNLLDWYPANFSLSTNDLNSVDIGNFNSNTNQFRCAMVAAPYFAGVYFSLNSGSSWTACNSGLLTTGLTPRNIDQVVFSKDMTYSLAFDNTSEATKGNVYYAEISESLIQNGAVVWMLLSTALNGKSINKCVSVENGVFWAATDSGIYASVDGGLNWTSKNFNLTGTTKIYDLHYKSDFSLEYGYGYGIGTGFDYFDVLGTAGILTGYGLDDFETAHPAVYGYGYGYEYGFSGGDIDIVFIATDLGVYKLIGETWVKIYDDIDHDSTAIHVNGDVIYVGKENGMVRSLDGGETFEGDSETDTYYHVGLLKQKVTSIWTNKDDAAEVFVSQYGGVFVSRNNGGNFHLLSNKLTENKIKQIILNPINNKLIYAVTETTKFSSAGVTFVVDTSESMYAADPQGKRFDMMQKIVDSITASANNPAYFQIIRFGATSKEYSSFLGSSSNDAPGVENITKGFTSNVNYLTEAILSLANMKSARTPVYEAFNVVAESLNRDGSSFEYDGTFKYKYSDIISKYYNELDKSVIIITDGNNNSLRSLVDELTAEGSAYRNIRGNIYLIATGLNVNYDALEPIIDAHQHINVYLAPYPENIYNVAVRDIGDVVLDREQYRKRTGTWKYFYNFEEKRHIYKLKVDAILPPGTECRIRVRVSEDKEIWSAWSGLIDANELADINYFGQYLEIEIEIESLYSTHSAEINKISVYSGIPSKNTVLFKERSTDERISEIYLSSLDDTSLNNIEENAVESKFGIGQTSSSNFNFYKTIHRDMRSVVTRKNYERLISDDGYYFYAESGGWPSDAQIEVYDTTEGVANVDTSMSPDLYFPVSDQGLIIFYEKVSSTRSLKVKFNFNDTIYRVGLFLTNYKGVVDYHLHDIAWMFNSAKTSTLSRDALPFVPSQLGEGDVFGFVSPQNHASGSSLSTKIISQYVNKDTQLFTSGIISLTNGYRINLKTTGTIDKWAFYEQNAYLDEYNLSNPTDINYVGIIGDYDKVTVSKSDLLNQINVFMGNKTLAQGESLSFVIGDDSKGSSGASTWLKQSNLLIDSAADTIGEISTTMIVGDTKSLSVEPSTALIEGAGEESFDGFDKPLSPSINLCGSTATRLVVLSQSNSVAGSSFSFIVLAVDDNGLRDMSYSGKIRIGFSDATFGQVSVSEYTFLSSDAGAKKFSGFVSESAIGYGKIKVSMDDNGNEFYSNPIVIDGKDRIRWGDLNVSSVFSDGRQDVSFIADYAKNVSKIDFVGIADDVGQLNSSEWNYMGYQCAAKTDRDLILIPGFRYRSDAYHGEHAVLFENLNSLPELPKDPATISGARNQIESLVNSLAGYDYISFPVHSPYESKDGLQKGRGMSYENYRAILGYSSPENMLDFIDLKEIAVEVYSEHGNAENNGTYQNDNFLESEETSYARYALEIGKKSGFIASSGGYSSRPGYYTGDIPVFSSLPDVKTSSIRGITAIRTDTLSRASIFEQIRNRGVYATTGARIYLDFEMTVTDQFSKSVILEMGRVENGLPVTENSVAYLYTPTLKFRMVADNSTITRVQIIKVKIDSDSYELVDSQNTSNAVFNHSNFGEDTGTLEYVDDELSMDSISGKEYCYYVIGTQDDGQMIWSSPIWLSFGRSINITPTKTDTIKDFKFSIVGNTAPDADAFDAVSVNPNFTTLIGKINDYNSELVVNIGNLIRGDDLTNSSSINDRWSKYKTESSKFGSSTYRVAGEDDIWNELSQDIWEEQFTNLYYSFNFKGSHFIVLNSEIEGGVSGDQLAWLTDDLESASDFNRIFVFVYRPLWATSDVTTKEFDMDSDWIQSIHPILRQAGVTAVFASGRNALQVFSTLNNIKYIVTGGGGTKYSLTESNGGFSHHLLVSIEGTSTLFNAIKIDGTTIAI